MAIDWNASPSSTGEITLTPADFAVPEFKKGSELYGVGSEENYSAMGAPPKPSTSIDWGTPEPIPPAPQMGSVDKPFHWIPTKEEFKGGFAGRILTGHGKDILPNENTPSVSESFKAIVAEAKRHPMGVVQDLYTGIIVDPWMLVPALWEATPVKLAALSARYVAAAAKVTPILGKAAQVTTKATRAAAIGGTAELGAQTAEVVRGERSSIDTQAIENTGAQFGAFAGVAKAVHSAFKPEIVPVASPLARPKVQEHVYNEFVDSTVKAMNTMEAQAHQGKRIADALRVASGNNPTLLERIFRAIDDPSKKTKLQTNAERHHTLNGDGSLRLDSKGNPIKIGVDATGRAIFATNDGLKGAYANMAAKLAKGRQALAAGRKGIFKTEAEARAYEESIPKTKAAIDYLESLPSEEHLIPFADKLRDLLFKDGVAARDAGVTEGLKYNYFTHLIDATKSNLSHEATAKVIDDLFKKKPELFKTDSSDTRLFRTAKDLQAHLNSLGLNLFVHTDAALVFEAYHKAITTSIAQKGIVEKLKTMTDAQGNPLITANASVPKYIRYEGPGNKQIRGLFVHPEIAPILDHMFQRADIGAVKDALLKTATFTKALNVAGSMFHAPSLGWALAGASPSLVFKEIITGGSGIRAALKEFKRGDMDAELNYAMESGVKLGTEDVNRSILTDVAAWTDSKMMGNTTSKVTQRIMNPLDKYILQKMNTFTWDYMHTGGKLLLFNHLLNKAERNIPERRYLADSTLNPNWTRARDAVAKEIATSVNDTMGGLQWLQAASSVEGQLSKKLAILGTGISKRQTAQIAMFAPDWTVSTLRAFTNGLPKEMLRPSTWDIKGGIKGIMKPMNKGDLARRYMVNTGLLYLTLLNGINMYTAGQFIWENEDPTRILHEDGTTQQLAKHSMESVHWIMDPGKTASNKLGFIPKFGMSLMDSRGGSVGNRVLTGAKGALPFFVSAGVNAPEGEGAFRTGMSSLGFPIYGKPDSYLRDPADIEKERREMAYTKAENKLQKAELEQKKSQRGKFSGLFD